MTPSTPSSEHEDVPDVDQVLADPAASDWIKRSLGSAIQRDPVDAADDAEVLAKILGRRCRQILAR